MLSHSPARRFFRPIQTDALPGIFFRMLLIALLSRTHLAGELSPFAPACFAAALAHGYSALPMLIGCAAGCLWDGFSLTHALPLFTCAAAYALHLAVRLLTRLFPAVDRQRDLTAAFCAGASMLAVSLSFSGRILYNIFISLLSAAAAALLAPALVTALGVRLSRRRLMQEEQLSFALLILLALCGVRALPYAGRFLAEMLAALLTLFCSAMGCGMGAMCGTAIGTCLTIGGGHPFIGSSLALCGLLAGVLRQMPRPCAAVVFVLGNTLTISWGLGYSAGALNTPPLITGAVLYCLIPMPLLLHLRGWLAAPLQQPDIERLSVQLRRQSAQKLDQLSEVFGALADGYGEAQTLPAEQHIILRLRKALCESCDGFAECWQGDKPQAGRLMCRLMAQGLSGKSIPRISELPPDLLRHCRRSSQIEQRMMPLLKQLAHKRRDELKRGESRALLGAQFRQAQQSLDALSVQLKGQICLHQDYAQLAHAALDRAGMDVQEVTALLDERIEFICTLRSSVWDERRARTAARLLARELGVPFSPVVSHGRVPEECELRLLQAPALTAAISAVSSAAQAYAPCGDSHIAQILPDGRIIAAISDGMGHGESAAAESQKCISLLRKFICAGVDRDAALAAVNRLLLLKSEEEMYATADLCVISLYSGIASFSKLAACRSFILQEKHVTCISGGRLPLGILDHIEPVSASIEIFPGDVIIMISDGIADELKEGQADELEKLITPMRSLPTDTIAQRILSWAQERPGEKDDMTTIVFRILSRC